MPAIVPVTLKMSLINMNYCSFYYHVPGTVTFLTYITSNPSNKSTRCLLLYLVCRGRKRGTEMEEVVSTAEAHQREPDGRNVSNGDGTRWHGTSSPGPPTHRLSWMTWPQNRSQLPRCRGESSKRNSEWLMESKGRRRKTRGVKPWRQHGAKGCKPGSGHHHVGVTTQGPEVRDCCPTVPSDWPGTPVSSLTSSLLTCNSPEHPHLEHEKKVTPASWNYTELLNHKVPPTSPTRNPNTEYVSHLFPMLVKMNN